MSETYKKNFLTKVILRLDFDAVELGLLEKRFYTDEIKDTFPNVQNKKAISRDIAINITSGEVVQKGGEQLAWQFQNANNTLRFEVSENYIFIEYDKYKNSEDLLEKISLIILPFIELNKIQTINRLGLRYINEVIVNEKKPLDWATYINNNLLGPVEFAKENYELSRNMTTTVFRANGSFINFRHGIWNNDYPNPIARKEYILDYDCYSKLPFNPNEENITDLIKKYNTYIENLFESSITEKLRKLLRDAK